MYASLEMNQVSASPHARRTLSHRVTAPTWPACLHCLWSKLAAWKPAAEQERQPAAASRNWRLGEQAFGRSALLTLEGDALSDTSVLAVVAGGRRMLGSRAKKILLDLRGVRQADSRLIASLVLLSREANPDRHRIALRASHCVSEWARVCRVEALLNQAVTEEA